MTSLISSGVSPRFSMRFTMISDISGEFAGQNKILENYLFLFYNMVVVGH